MDTWSEPGHILRWWRTDVLGLSQQQAAARLDVGATTLSNWETSTRETSIPVERLDEQLDGGGVLAGLLWAVGTPTGLDARRIWTKVFPGPSAPVWMWVRSPATEIRLEGEWGVFRIEAEIPLGPNGFFVTVGGSVAESPVVVQLSEPGWADFGWGQPPAEVEGAEVIAALDIARPSTATGVFMELFSSNMAEGFKRSRPSEISSLARRAPRLVADFFTRFSRSQPRSVAGPWPPVPDVGHAGERRRFAQLREARNLSMVETTERLSAATGVRISKDTLRRFEGGKGEPQDRLLPVALDHVLGAEGHLALAELRSGSGSVVLRIPPYWYAPVWFAFDGPDEPAELVWGAWRRRIDGPRPLLVVSHYAEPFSPLRIVTGESTRWTAGVGRRPGAMPINQGWTPVSLEDAQRAISGTEDAVLDAMRARERDGYRDGADDQEDWAP